MTYVDDSFILPTTLEQVASGAAAQAYNAGLEIGSLIAYFEIGYQDGYGAAMLEHHRDDWEPGPLNNPTFAIAMHALARLLNDNEAPPTENPND